MAEKNSQPSRSLKASIRDVSFGENVTVVEPSNLYECIIGDDVFIGPFCEVQKNVVIGDKTRVQSHAFICSNVAIGAGCFIGHGVTFINDRFRDGHVRLRISTPRPVHGKEFARLSRVKRSIV